MSIWYVLVVQEKMIQGRGVKSEKHLSRMNVGKCAWGPREDVHVPVSFMHVCTTELEICHGDRDPAECRKLLCLNNK